jgi:predicted acetyltransferase
VTTPVSVRPVTHEEYREYGTCLATAFGSDYDPEEQARERELIPLADTLAAFDGDRLVGTEGVFRMTVTIPGSRVPMAGVTSVSVLPTHRRRGILTALMRHRLEDMHARGQWLAGLWASESLIYGRFGYGVATQRIRLEVDKRRSAFTGQPARGEVRLVTRGDAQRLIPPIYERAAAERPGMLGREGWWAPMWHDPKEQRGGRSGSQFAVHATDGTDDGYAVYRTRFDWLSQSTPEVLVEDLVTTSDAAYAGTWRYLLDIDLMQQAISNRRPVDEPLLWMLADRGAAQARLSEGMWLRLVDVPQALTSRTYTGEGSLVLEVHDTFCPWNDGRYALAAGGGGATCEPTSKPADLVLSAADLAAAYLGGVKLSSLVRAQRVTEARIGAAAAADALFGGLVVPWCDRVF